MTGMSSFDACGVSKTIHAKECGNKEYKIPIHSERDVPAKVLALASRAQRLRSLRHPPHSLPSEVRCGASHCAARPAATG